MEVANVCWVSLEYDLVNICSKLSRGSQNIIPPKLSIKSLPGL